MNLLYVTGSTFWKMNAENSDMDLTFIVTPNKDQLFKGELVIKHTKDKYENDVKYQDVRYLIRNLRKGSLNDLVLLFDSPINKPALSDNSKRFFNLLKENRYNILDEIKPKLIRSLFGELKQRLNYYQKKENKEEKLKNLAHAYKLNFLIENINNGFINKWFKEKAYEKALDIRNDKENSEKIFYYLSYKAEELKETNFPPKNNITPCLDMIEEETKNLCFEIFK